MGSAAATSPTPRACRGRRTNKRLFRLLGNSRRTFAACAPSHIEKTIRGRLHGRASPYDERKHGMLKDFSFSGSADRVVFVLLTAAWASGIAVVVMGL